VLLGVPLGFFFAALGTSSANLDPDMPTRKAVIEGFKDMGRTGYRNAKTFALIGGLWSTTECFIEKVRGQIRQEKLSHIDYRIFDTIEFIVILTIHRWR
jgi:hypothetical protein